MKTIAIIGREEAFDDQKKWFVNASYIDAFAHYHCALFPVCSYASLAIAQDVCDGLIIPGGYDMHSFYIEEPCNAACTYYDGAQDHFDLSCIDAFVKNKKPILGICRGLQVLHIYFHGTLIQDFSTEEHAPQHCHELQLPQNSRLRQLYPLPCVVNSYHHQAAADCPKDIEILAYSHDGHIEAWRHQTLPILAVQWHPERLPKDPLLAYFLDIMIS